MRSLPYLPRSVQRGFRRSLRRGQRAKAYARVQKRLAKLPARKREHARLAVAHLAMSLADTKRAMSLYRKLSRNRSRRVSLVARVMAARFLLSQREPARALRALAPLGKKAPGGKLLRFWVVAWMIHATALSRLSRHGEAIQAYKRLLRLRLVIRDTLAYWVLRQSFRQKQYARALVESRRFLKLYKKSRWRPWVRFLEARSLEARKDWKRALVAYRGLVLRKAARVSAAMLGAARCALRLKRRTAARRSLLQLVRRYPGRAVATRALALWKREFGVSKKPALVYLRARHWYRGGRFRRAAALFLRLAPLPKAGKRRPAKAAKGAPKRRAVAKPRLRPYQAQAAYYGGRSLFRLERYKDACRLLRWLLRQAPKHKLARMASLYWIRSNYRLRKNLKAVKHYEVFWRKHERHPYGHLALWWAAQLYSEHKQEARSISLFQRYFRRYKKKRRAPEALIKVGLVHVQKKRYKRAIKALKPATQLRASIAARAWFWIGKSYERQGLRKKALAAFRRIRAFSDSYYVARARERLTKQPLLRKKPISIYRLVEDEEEARKHRGAIERWYARAYGKKKRKASLRKVAQAVVRSRPYRRALLFALAGNYTRVRAEFAVIRRQAKKAPVIFYLLARAWLAFGRPHRAIPMVGLFVRNLPAKHRRLLPSRSLRRLRYPIPFPHLYERFGAMYKVRPLVMLAITRQESIFHPSIISRAGAIGLAQIMPKEARRLAARWKLRNFRTSHLYRPRLNLRMGFFLFRKYLQRYKKLELALIAYNAGPVPLRRWLKAHPTLAKQDLEAFVEFGVGYRETRGYIPACLRWYSLYRLAFAS